MTAGLLLNAALRVALVQMDPQAGVMDQYVEEQVSYQIGGAYSCSPRGQKRLFAEVQRRLSAIRSALVARFGSEAVTQAEMQIGPRFDDVTGTVSPSGCRKDAASDRASLRDLREEHEAALSNLERMLGLSKEGRH